MQRPVSAIQCGRTAFDGSLLLDGDAINMRLQVGPFPGRPKAVYGIARAAQATGDRATAHQRYQQFLTLWKNADPDRPEVTTAKEFLGKEPAAAE